MKTLWNNLWWDKMFTKGPSLLWKGGQRFKEMRQYNFITPHYQMPRISFIHIVPPWFLYHPIPLPTIRNAHPQHCNWRVSLIWLTRRTTFLHIHQDHGSFVTKSHDTKLRLPWSLTFVLAFGQLIVALFHYWEIFPDTFTDMGVIVFMFLLCFFCFSSLYVCITWSSLLLINVCYYYLSYCGSEGETNYEIIKC